MACSVPQTSPEVSSRTETTEAIDRLLSAWRGEIQARATYSILAGRMKDPRRAEVIRAIADAEGAHRERIEGRLKELGQPVPDPATVKLSLVQRLQARLAPIEVVMTRMEAAEEFEIQDRYKRPTGDPATDAVLESIRAEEQGHSRSLDSMQAAHHRDEPPPSSTQSRLNRILGRETWHRTGSGWISGAIYGANDGLAAVFGIVAGVSGATGGSSFVLTAGLFGAIASALSMATGAFLAERSEAEVAAANVARERQEVIENPDEEKEEVSLFYQLKGIDKGTADMLAEQLSKDPEALLKVHAPDELGNIEATSQPAQAALAAGISTFVGAMVPVIPFFFLRGTAGVITAALVSLIAHFLVGAAKSLFTLRKWWSAGLEMTLAGVIVGGITYGIGLVLKVGGP
ncbi:MAG TPA: VIT1/CCC1 transporter family protein [Myxococcaceae bacterium]